MRIGLLASLYHPRPGYRAAGIHRYIQALLEALPAALPPGWILEAFGPAGDPPTPPPEGVAWRGSRWPLHRPVPRILWEQIVLPGRLGGLGLLHGTHHALPLLWRGRAVVTFHDFAFLRHPAWHPRGRRLYLAAVSRLAARRARRILCVSAFTAREAAALLGVDRARLRVVPNGVDLEAPDPAAVAAARTVGRIPERYLLVLGTWEPRKNQAVVVRAFRKVRRDRPEGTVLVLAGGRGWGYGELEALLAADREGILTPGYLPDEELPLWYAGALAVCVPSRYEGFGLPALEAMACGAPVLAADAAALPEVVGDAGRLLPPDDVDAWAQALVRLARDPDLRARLGEAGRARAARYTWERTARETVAVYREVLEEG